MVGLAVGLAVFAPVKVAEGVQVYPVILVPATVKVDEPPLQIVKEFCGDMVKVGIGLIVTVTVKNWPI